MPFLRKLQLARFSWNLFLEEDAFDENIAQLVSKMKALKEKEGNEETSSPSGGE